MNYISLINNSYSLNPFNFHGFHRWHQKLCILAYDNSSQEHLIIYSFKDFLQKNIIFRNALPHSLTLIQIIIHNILHERNIKFLGLTEKKSSSKIHLLKSVLSRQDGNWSKFCDTDVIDAVLLMALDRYKFILQICCTMLQK